MADVQHIYKQAGPPTNPPPGEGHHWVDTVAGTTYISKGVSSVSDWQLMGSGGLPNGGGTGQILQKLSNIDGDAGWVNQPGYNDTANTLAGYNASGNLYSIPGWAFDPTVYGISGSLTIQPNNGGGNNLNAVYAAFDPIVNSPNESWNVHTVNLTFDNADAGFTFGTAGTAVNIYNNYFTHQNSSNIGAVNFTTNNFNLGNGVDAITVNGISYSYGFGTINANVDMVGPLQGYGFQINANAAATISSYISGFYDASNFQCQVDSYTSANLSPTVAGVSNNNNLSSINIGPNVTTFSGNASYTGIGIFPTLGTFGTGGFQGVSINPNVTAANYFLGFTSSPTIGTVSTYYHGLDINPTITTIPNGGGTGIYVNVSNIAGTGHKAAEFVGDVNITGALTFSGALSIGKLNAYFSQALVDGGGVPTTIHGLISAPTIAANQTVANADTLGVNTAALITIGDNATVTTAFLGIAALGLPAVVSMGSGSTVDLIEGAVFAISLDAGATGGTIDTVPLCRATALPNGITTVNKLHGFDFVLPFGNVGTEQWGFYTSVDCYNWFKGSLKLGGTAGVSDKVTNSSVIFELESTTGAFLNARMNTTQRDALTAINGMQIYNTTTGRLEAYENGQWALSGTLFAQTADVTVANTTTETSLVGAGVGTLTIPANYFQVGKTIRLRGKGYHSSVGSATVRIRIKLGAVTVLDTTAHASHNDTNAGVEIEAQMTVRSLGATGTIMAQGAYAEHGTTVDVVAMTNLAATVIDTTVSNAIDVTLEWGTASASNTFTLTNLLVEYV